MIKTLLTTMMILSGRGAYAEGMILLGTLGATAQPNVITTDNGGPAGAGFQAALFYAPDGVTNQAMFSQIGPSTEFIDGTGLILGTERIVPTSMSVERANFQIRAWESAFGSTFEESRAHGGLCGKSAIISRSIVESNPTLPLDPFLPPPGLVTAANAAGIPLGFQLSVAPVNNPPAVTPSVMVSLDENTSTTITLQADDMDTPSLEFTITVAPAYGVLSGVPALTSAGVPFSFTYTPTPGYHGPDGFSYAVHDGNSTASGAVTIEVQDLHGLLAHFALDGNGEDRLGASPPMDLVNTSYLEDTLCLNGTYDDYSAAARITGFSYATFTVALDFYPLSLTQGGGGRDILTGGTVYSWLSLHIVDGHLALTLNDGESTHVFLDTQLSINHWQRLVCAVHLSGSDNKRMIRTFHNGMKQEDIGLASGFSFNVVGTPAEESDKRFTFINYGNGQAFHGYADNLMVFGNALGDSEIDSFFSPPILQLQYGDENDIRIHFISVAGRSYVVEHTERLPASAWIPFPPVLGNGVVAGMTDSSPLSSMRFYRAR